MTVRLGVGLPAMPVSTTLLAAHLLLLKPKLFKTLRCEGTGTYVLACTVPRPYFRLDPGRSGQRLQQQFLCPHLLIPSPMTHRFSSPTPLFLGLLLPPHPLLPPTPTPVSPFPCLFLAAGEARQASLHHS